MDNEELDDLIKTYIYESPDKGETVTRREFGHTDKETIVTPSSPSDYYIDTTVDTIDLSGILTGGSISSNTMSIDTYEDFNDITLDVNGKTRKVSELFTSVDAIEKRLGILQPDPKLLEKYEVLRGFYDQYKAAEALLYEDMNDDE